MALAAVSKRTSPEMRPAISRAIRSLLLSSGIVVSLLKLPPAARGIPAPRHRRSRGPCRYARDPVAAGLAPELAHRAAESLRYVHGRGNTPHAGCRAARSK